MTNSVGTVAIDLAARIAKFESDLGRAARIAEAQSAAMRKSLSTIAEVLGAGISIAGITAWVKGAIDAQDEMSKLSQKVAVGTETLSGWEQAAKLADVGNEALQKGLIKLAQSSAAAAVGGKEQAATYKSVGISVTDATGHLKSLGVLLPEIADKFAAHKDSVEKTVLATQIFGKAGADLIPLLDAGSKGLQEGTDNAKLFGLAVDQQAAKACERLNDALTTLKSPAAGLANTIATALAPALADLAESAVTLFHSDTWKSTLDSISTGAKTVADHIDDIVISVKTLGEVVATVYGLKILKFGADWVISLAAQTTAVKGLIVAQSEWGAATAGSFATAAKNIGALGIAFNLVGVAFTGWEIGKYLSDQFLDVRLAAIAFVDGTLVAWQRIKEGALIAWAAIELGWDLAVAGIKVGIKAAIEAFAQLSLVQGNLALYEQAKKYADSMDTSTSATQKFAKSLVDITTQTNRNIADVHAQTGAMADFAIAAQRASAASAAFTKQVGTIAGGINVKSSKTDLATAEKRLQIAGQTAVQAGVSQTTVAEIIAQADQRMKTAMTSTANAFTVTGTAAADAAAKQAQAFAAVMEATQQRIAADKEALNVGPQITQAEKERAKIVQALADGTLVGSKAKVADLMALLNYDVQLEKDIALQKDKAAGMAALATQQEALDAALNNQADQNAINLIGVGHGSQLTQEMQDQLRLQQEYQGRVKDINKQANRPENIGKTLGVGGDTYNQLLANAKTEQDKQTAIYKQGIDDRMKLEADGWNGARSAMEDFMAAQQNVAAQVHQFTTNLIDGFGDAFASFASGTETAKKAFGDWIDSMYQQALKFLANKAIQALFDSFNTNGIGNTAGTTAGGFGSILSNFASYFSSSSSGSIFSDTGAFGIDGSFAGGGTVMPGGLYRVNENGPELYSQGGKTFLMGGDQQGTVTPITRAAGRTNITNVYVQPTSTRRTADQVATEVARKQRIASTRNG